MKEPDPGLLERCRKHDAEAFAQLVAQQQDYVYTLARRALRDNEEAADVTQEIFLRVWQGLPYFRGQARFRTWLYRIAVNQCLNRLRKLKRERDTVSLDEETVQRLADQAGDVPTEALARERQRLVWDHVELLPTRYRIVLNLYYQQEMPCAEIADVLGMPVATVKTHLYRARAALASALPQGGSDVL